MPPLVVALSKMGMYKACLEYLKICNVSSIGSDFARAYCIVGDLAETKSTLERRQAQVCYTSYQRAICGLV